MLAALAAAASSRKDVVLALAGAAGALVGFVLIFLGILVSSYQSLLGRISRDALASFKTAASAALGVFLVGLVSLTVSIVWLVVAGGTTLYVVSLVLFFAELGGLAGVAVYASRRVLLR